jgi:group I intron endonuclease
MKDFKRNIFLTTNTLNGKIYVGQSAYDNPKYLGSGKIFKLALNKYGSENFKKTIIEYCDSPEMLDEREIYWIKKLNSRNPDIGYNILKGGKGNAYIEYIENMSSQCTGLKNGMFGKHHSKETREKIRQKALGRKVSLETKKKLSESRKGNKNHFYGKKHKQHTLDSISKSRTGKMTGEHNHSSKTFIFIDPNNVKYTVFANFGGFCDKNNLSTAKMKRFINKGIIPDSPGHRCKMTTRSINCIGWQVSNKFILKHDL